MFAIPIQVGAIQLGVLDLYRTATGPLTAAQLLHDDRGDAVFE